MRITRQLVAASLFAATIVVFSTTSAGSQTAITCDCSADNEQTTEAVLDSLVNSEQLFEGTFLRVKRAPKSWIAQCGEAAVETSPDTPDGNPVHRAFCALLSRGDGASDLHVFKVDSAWKGVEAKRVLLLAGTSTCSYRFEQGERYLVFATHYSVSICTRTAPSDEAELARQSLGEPEYPRVVRMCAGPDGWSPC